MRRRQGLCVLSWCRGIYRGGVTGSLFLAQQLNGDNFPAWGRSRLLKVHPCSGGPVLRRHGNWPTVEPNCPVREAVHYAGLSNGRLWVQIFSGVQFRLWRYGSAVLCHPTACP